MLERVRGRSLGGQHRPGIALEPHQHYAGLDAVAVLDAQLDLDLRIERAEERGGDLQPGGDDRFAAFISAVKRASAAIVALR